MRPRLENARVQLAAVLSRRAAVSAGELAQALQVSVATLHRILPALGDDLVVTGQARRTRYALRAPLRGDMLPLPLYAVDETGRADELGALSVVQPEGSCLPLADSIWPMPDEARAGWWPGLPYLLQDMRPQGYLGRQFARACHREMAVAPNPNEWSDADVAFVLSRQGSDCSGNLILGNPALERWQAQRRAPPVPLPARRLLQAYAGLAEQAVAAGVAGSSAAGEFPKFPALRDLAGSATPHVLVKFSGADSSASVRRWSDLLVCEHLALQSAELLPGVEAARSRVLQQEGGRCFLELERFDRHGLHGRSPLICLATVDAAFLGLGNSDWRLLATRLGALNLLDQDTQARIQRLWWFGRLIANTDMHTGNLSFRPQHTLALAPAYDMLPMLYAPLSGGEVPARNFEPALPLPAERDAWTTACEAALAFWREASADRRISSGFRRICSENLRSLQATAEHA